MHTIIPLTRKPFFSTNLNESIDDLVFLTNFMFIDFFNNILNSCVCDFGTVFPGFVLNE